MRTRCRGPGSSDVAGSHVFPIREDGVMKRILILSTSVAMLVAAGSTALHAQGRGRGRGEKPDKPNKEEQRDRVSAEEQQRRAQEEQRRAAAYQQRLDQQLRVLQQQNAQLEQQKRAAQLREQQQYAIRLQQQRQRLQAARDYSRDPYVSAPHTFRCTFAGTTRQTNQYGADLLRQAVNDGYQQGYLAGRADHQDHWRASYQNSQAYRDADYGYTGNYIDEADYSYYFRQGFRRGYDDGYNTRLQYGTTSGGSASILSNVLTAILGLVPIR